MVRFAVLMILIKQLKAKINSSIFHHLRRPDSNGHLLRSRDLAIICRKQQQQTDRPITLPLVHACWVTTAAACVPVRVEFFRFFPVVGVTMYGHDGDDHLSSLGNGQIFGGKCFGASSSATEEQAKCIQTLHTDNLCTHTLPQEGTFEVLPG